jgi:hypothetical protein
MDLYSLYSRTDLGTKIEAIFGTIYEAVYRFFVVVSGPYRIVRTGDYGYRRGRTTVQFWHEKRCRFLWDRFGAVRYFPWLEMLFCC